MIDRCYLPDANGVINLLRDGVRARTLNKLGDANQLKVVDGVARELRGRDGKAKSWVDSRPQYVVDATRNDRIVAEMERLAKAYGHLFTVTARAADPILVATACFYRDTDPCRTIVTDDGGVQAVCLHEGIAFAPFKAFRRLMGI